MSGRRWVVLMATATASGCAYYNGMWSAEQHASAARRLEARGQASEARAEWTQAASKAEVVTLRHPRSRWADDALVLQVEALARSGACQNAAEPLGRARARVPAGALRERLDLAAAECALAEGDPVEADAALTASLVSRDAERRSRAEYLAGQAAMLRTDYAGAVEHFRRSSEAPAREQALASQFLLRVAQARTPDDLSQVAAELRADHGNEAAHLLSLLTRVMSVAETPAARFHGAEVARDSLHAPALAARMFLDAAAREPASLYAAKALIAALAISPDRRDSIVAVLDSRYVESPYTRAFHGEPSLAYAAAEDSLAKALGVPTARVVSSPVGPRFGVPLPGRRGPLP